MSKHIDNQSLNNANIETVIVGLGVTGLSCARFLARRGQSFAVTDSRAAPPGLNALLEEYPEVITRCGELDADLIMQARQCLVSPGVSIRQQMLERAEQAGVKILGDVELFARHARAPVIAITGANGKSTVTTLVYEMAKACGLTVRAGGNLGTAALDLIEETEPDLYILELSSFQLETTHSLNPVAATVLNISEDHMDRYADVADYADAKERVFQGQGVMVINADDPQVLQMRKSDRKTCLFSLKEPAGNEFGVRIKKTEGKRADAWLVFGDSDLMPVSEMKIKGMHNVANGLAALALGHAASLNFDGMLQALRTFPGLEHRCQWVANKNGVDWYNDSKGTNEGATCAAIEGLAPEGSIILIAGGDAKGAKFDNLGYAAKGRVKRAILIGKDAPSLKAALTPYKVPVEDAVDMQAAVEAANKVAQAGDLVLLSPACASLDMYKNYMVRGQTFVEAVLKL